MLQKCDAIKSQQTAASWNHNSVVWREDEGKCFQGRKLYNSPETVCTKHQTLFSGNNDSKNENCQHTALIRSPHHPPPPPPHPTNFFLSKFKFQSAGMTLKIKSRSPKSNKMKIRSRSYITSLSLAEFTHRVAKIKLYK